MSRVANGWIPSGVTDQAQSLEGDHEHFLDDDGVGLADLQSSVVQSTAGARPRTLLEEVDHEAIGWGWQWGCHRVFPDCEWPSDLGDLPPQLEVACFRDAIRTFPAQLGLGWDAIHPRALPRRCLAWGAAPCSIPM